jgi:uncharacterized membrane protein
VDLYAATIYTTVTVVLLLIIRTDNPLAAFLVLFVPGYVLVAALFPANLDIDWVERLALSLGLSIAVVPLLGGLLVFTPWGISFTPVMVSIAVFTLGLGLTAYWRRMRLPAEQRLAVTLSIRLPAWREYSVLDKVLTIALGASLATAVITLTYIGFTPRPPEAFSEFYILGPGGNASGYPTALNVTQTGTVIMGIANHESANVNYAIRVDLVGVRIVYNTTSKSNETFEVNRTAWSRFNITLANGNDWTQPYAFRINYVGLWKVQFLLFKDGNSSKAYREFHLFVRVTVR